MKLLLIALYLFSTIAFSHETSLYLSDQTKYETSQLSMVLSKLIEQKSKNILFYIHGRGKEPQKGFETIPLIEKRYGVKVVMFHWDSWISKYKRPVQNAIDAGVDLLDVLTQLNEYKISNPQITEGINISLLTHSMGSIVFENMLKAYNRRSFNSELFHNILINQSDSKAKNHHEWLSKADFCKNIFVTSSKKDFVLKLSQKINPGRRLGIGIAKRKGFFKWVNRVKYINLAKVTGKKHKTYLVDKKKKYRSTFRFYKRILSSKNMSNTKLYKIKTDIYGRPGPQLFELRK